MARVTGSLQIIERQRGPVYYLRFRTPSGRQVKELLGPAWVKRVKAAAPSGRERAIQEARARLAADHGESPAPVADEAPRYVARDGRCPADAFTPKKAEEALQDRLAEVRRGEVSDPAERSGRTFADAREEWLRYCAEDRDLSDTTLRDYRNTSRGALTAEFGEDTPIEAIDEDMIERYRTKMLSGTVVAKRGGRDVVEREDGRTISRRTAQKRLVLLGGIFKRAKRLKWIAVNPTADVEPINLKSSGDFNVLTVEQVEAVARAAVIERPTGEVEADQDFDELAAEIFSAAILVAAYTGLRTGELRALRWRDVDFAAATIHVRKNKPAGGEEKAPKSEKVRSVPLMDDAARALDRLSRRQMFTASADRVFASATGGMVGEDAFRDALYEAMAAAGIDRKSFPARDGFVFHDLRHTFGTLAVRVWPLSDVQAYMGHADVDTTMQYVHHIPKTTAAREFSEAIERMKAAPEIPPLKAAA
jgi:integrase